MSPADISDNDCNDASDIEIVTDTVRGFLRPVPRVIPAPDYRLFMTIK